MHNADRPTGYEPPSSAKLLRSTAIAAVIAAILLVVAVLPAEYGIDPTGIGAAIGLKRMGEIKTQLAAEAEANAVPTLLESEPSDGALSAVGPIPKGEAAPMAAPIPKDEAVSRSDADVQIVGQAWRDELDHVLQPDQAVEFKLVMEAGAVAEYSWTAVGGTLNYNTHGDGGGKSVEYKKGRDASGQEGNLTAAFDGYHGWYWRNRSGNAVTLTLRTRGDYSELKRTS